MKRHCIATLLFVAVAGLTNWPVSADESGGARLARSDAAVTDRAKLAFLTYADVWKNPGALDNSPFASNAVFEYPGGPAGQLVRIQGRKAIHERIAARAQFAADRQFAVEGVFATASNRIAFIQYRARAKGLASGDILTQPYLAEIEMAQNRIVHLREFADPGGPLSRLEATAHPTIARRAQ